MKTIILLLCATAVLCNAQDQQKEPPPDFVPVEKQPQPLEGFKPVPVYPDSARRKGIEGMVWVKIWIDEHGDAHKAEVVRSDHSIFDRNAIDAAMKWKFSPAVLNGKPVAVWVTLPFRFLLNPKTTAPPAEKQGPQRKPVPQPKTK